MRRMKRARSTPPQQLGHRWYFAEWVTEVGKRQADVQRELGWPKATVSELWNNKQRYTQDYIDAAARWLEIAPFELLMHPKEAKALRQLRKAAYAIVGDEAQLSDGKTG